MSDLRHLTDWCDVPDGVWDQVLRRALHHRAHREWTGAARGKALGLVFLNPSLRTRASMELAAAHLGAHPVTLTPGTGSWGLEWRDGARMDGAAAEHVREAFGVLSRYADALGVRTFASLSDHEADASDAAFRAIVAASTVPVVNLESARAHPCQALADAAALHEHYGGDLAGRRFVLTWAPHPRPLPRAVPNSAVRMAARMGMHVVIARPEGFQLEGDVMGEARALASRFGGSVTETTDRAAAFEGVHAVYAKAWAGAAVYDDPDAEAHARAAHADWTVTASDMAATDGGVFMHCLPVRRGVVVEDAVLDGTQPLHLQQAEYRLHAQKAILEWMWGLL